MVSRVGDEQPADEPGERRLVSRGQAAEQRRNVGLEARRGLGHERPAVVGQADQDRPPVRHGRNAHDQAAALGTVDKPGDAGLVESQQPGQLVHGRPSVAQHTEQARLDHREVVFRGPVLEHAVNEEGELRQPVDGTQLLAPGRGREPGT